MDVLAVIFWICLFALMHTYVIYPSILSLLSRGRKLDFSTEKEDKSSLSILMSVYNEESVLQEKILSIAKNNFDGRDIELLIGSDASTDDSNELLQQLSKQYKWITFYPFETRRGKASVINDLVQKANNEILILTDANVMFDKNTINEILAPFADENIGLVDARLISINKGNKGVAKQELIYNELETKMKYAEGLLWGSMMGPSGGCYAIRKSLYENIPANHLVDDFYVNMNVLKKGAKAITTLDATCFEIVEGDPIQEFRRKVRISAGNFQNLLHFFGMAFRLKSNIAFAFWSHKILRWLGSFFIITAFVLACLLNQKESIYSYYLLTQGAFFVLILLDLLLKPLKLKTGVLRSVTHFYLMNLALLFGFFKFLLGVKSGVWQPTKRIDY